MNMCKTLKAGPVAPNNLDKMIRRSGLKNNMVAELKGIQPATLSRHKSGDIGISLGDAEEYAKILNCTAQQIFFSSPPIPVLAAVFPFHEDCGINLKKMAPEIIGSHNGGYPELVLCPLGGKMERTKPYQNKAVYVHDYYAQDTMCIYWDLSGDLDHPNAWQHGNLDIVNIEPMQRNVVSKDCLGHYSVAKTKSNILLYGIIYQSGRNKYSVESFRFGCHQNIEIEWASPIISSIWRPELREMQWVEYDVTSYREKMMPHNT